MNRKLIKQGKGGFTIYLPKKWVDAKGLKEGDSISLSVDDNFLVINTESNIKKAITLDINDSNKDDIKHVLTHVYRRGFDIVKINNIDITLFKRIKKTTEDFLLGFEITEKEENYCVLENISEPTEKKYHVLLKRCFTLVTETIESIIEDFGKYSNAHEIKSLMMQQEKFLLFCRRILIKEKHKKSLVEWELMTFLMHIEHGLHYMYRYAVDNKIKKDFDILRTLIKLRDYFEVVQDAYYKKDLKYVHKLFSKRKDYCFTMPFEYIEKGKKKAGLFAHIRGIFRFMQISCSPIMSKLLEEQIESQVS
jgi:phosphate uptake regulator